MKNYTDDFLKSVHKGSTQNKTEILKSPLCGCFYCLTTYKPVEIGEWIKEIDDKETALCPNCGIDSVLSSQFPVNDIIFLKEMNTYWF